MVVVWRGRGGYTILTLLIKNSTTTPPEKNNELPKNGVEYIPFIEAFAHENDWAKAKQLTFQANRISERMTPYLCPIWQNMDRDTAPESILLDVQDKLNCEGLLP